ncbi:MAG: polyphosphate polymerase domain-containing protein [Lachnospiraceae bacterium]|nr:polyphosphate polymerase domain-containing protein [Lachnospiraceae bacterium]
MGAEERIFKRYEVKYLLSATQYEALRQRIDEYLVEDVYGEKDICNCYYDTPDFRLIRNSLEKPVYKEKLRLRSYGVPEEMDSTVYLELKKKFKGVVYKRREAMTLEAAIKFLKTQQLPVEENQILREMKWFLDFYHNLQPAMYLSYRRVALFEKESEVRVTFDWDIRWRRSEVDLLKGIYGELLLQPGQRIMEVKTLGAMPKWFADTLDELQIYPCSFSKYGRAYEQWLSRKQSSQIA